MPEVPPQEHSQTTVHTAAVSTTSKTTIPFSFTENLRFKRLLPSAFKAAAPPVSDSCLRLLALRSCAYSLYRLAAVPAKVKIIRQWCDGANHDTTGCPYQYEAQVTTSVEEYDQHEGEQGGWCEFKPEWPMAEVCSTQHRPISGRASMSTCKGCLPCFRRNSDSHSLIASLVS